MPKAKHQPDRPEHLRHQRERAPGEVCARLCKKLYPDGPEPERFGLFLLVPSSSSALRERMLDPSNMPLEIWNKREAAASSRALPAATRRIVRRPDEPGAQSGSAIVCRAKAILGRDHQNMFSMYQVLCTRRRAQARLDRSRQRSNPVLSS